MADSTEVASRRGFPGFGNLPCTECRETALTTTVQTQSPALELECPVVWEAHLAQLSLCLLVYGEGDSFRVCSVEWQVYRNNGGR